MKILHQHGAEPQILNKPDEPPRRKVTGSKGLALQGPPETLEQFNHRMKKEKKGKFKITQPANRNESIFHPPKTN
jgi:hypothetical protein